MATGRDLRDPAAVGRTAVEELRVALHGLLGRPVVRLERLSGGASRETWAVDVATDDALRPTPDTPRDPLADASDASDAPVEVERLILQRRRGGASDLGGDVGGEARLLQAAADAGVPVPELVGSGTTGVDGGVDGGIDGPWTLCRRVAGEALPRRVLSDDRYGSARSVLARQCGAALAAVHRIDPMVLGGATAAREPIADLRAVLDGVSGARPVLELALRRLEVDRPTPRRPAVVHGDFRLGNLLVDDDGLVAVLDWELAHVGDPIEDLGWFCVRAWRFGAGQRAGGVGSVEDLLAGYVEAGGAAVPAAELDWWELYGTVRWGVICAVQAEAHLGGAARSVELAAIGRRACETEFDALVSLGIEVPEPVSVDPAAGVGAGVPAPHDRPTALELIESVREFLDSDIRGATDGRVRFHAAVASRVLDVVDRELRAGDGPARRHRAALTALGVESDAALVDRIRSGALDADWREVADAFAPVVADKLAVANPRYRG